MNINQIENILREFYEENKDIVDFIFIGGSKCLSYIQNPNDIDVFVVFKTLQNPKARFGKIHQLSAEIKKIYENVSVLPQFKETFNYWLDESNYDEEHPTKMRFPIYVYMARDFQIVCGSDSVGIKNYDVLEHKTRYISALKAAAETFNYTFYRLLIGLYIIKNNSYELTQEQIANVNVAHDRQDEDKILELYNWAKSEIQKL